MPLALATALACSAAPGAPGPEGPQGVRANAQGVESDCAPGAYFCDGTKLWRCSRNGLDAKLVQDCASIAATGYVPAAGPAPAPRGSLGDALTFVQGTATNPLACITAQCPQGAAACCVATEPTCVWDLTSGVVASGTYRNGQVGAAVCNAPYAVACASTWTPFQVAWLDSTQSCPAQQRQLVLSIDRTRVAPGVVNIQAAGTAVSLTLTQDDPTQSCAAWSGTVEWTEAPDWSARIDASCAETGKGTLVLRGTLHGRT